MRRNRYLLLVGIVAVTLVVAVVAGLVVARFRREATERDAKICASAQVRQEDTRKAILDAGLEAGEALITVAGADGDTNAQLVEVYRSELITRLTDQLAVDLPPVVCDSGAPETPRGSL